MHVLLTHRYLAHMWACEELGHDLMNRRTRGQFGENMCVTSARCSHMWLEKGVEVFLGAYRSQALYGLLMH